MTHYKVHGIDLMAPQGLNQLQGLAAWNMQYQPQTLLQGIESLQGTDCDLQYVKSSSLLQAGTPKLTRLTCIACRPCSSAALV